jgi:hypothetical protein
MIATRKRKREEVVPMLFQLITRIPVILDMLDDQHPTSYFEDSDLARLMKSSNQWKSYVAPQILARRWYSMPQAITLENRQFVKRLYVDRSSVLPESMLAQISHLSWRDGSTNPVVEFCNLRSLDLHCWTNWTNSNDNHQLPSTLQSFQCSFYGDPPRSWIFDAVSIALTLTTMKLRGNFDVSRFSFHESLTDLDISNDHCKETQCAIRFPSSLHRLTLGGNFDGEVVLPEKLEHLTLGDSFSRHLAFPTSLKSLVFGKSFNQNLDMLHHLRMLRIGARYNQRTELPAGLEILELSENDRECIMFPKLPSNLRIIVSRCLFALTDMTMPPFLEKFVYSLSCHRQYVSPHLYLCGTVLNEQLILERCLSLKIFEMRIFSNLLIDSFPTYLHTLKLHGSFTRSIGVLPQTLRTLDLCECDKFNQSLQLPSNLVCLRMGDAFNQYLGILPLNLTTLSLGQDFNWMLESLPNNLLIITIGKHYYDDCIGGNFDHALGILPGNLQILELGSRFNHDLGILPSSLQRLKIGDSFNHDLGILPASLTKLLLGDEFNHSLRLVEGIEEVYLGKSFNQSIITFPQSLEYLNIADQYFGQRSFGDKNDCVFLRNQWNSNVRPFTCTEEDWIDEMRLDHDYEEWYSWYHPSINECE